MPVFYFSVELFSVPEQLPVQVLQCHVMSCHVNVMSCHVNVNVDVDVSVDVISSFVFNAIFHFQLQS